MTDITFVILFILLIVSLFGFMIIQYSYHLNSIIQNDMYADYNQPSLESFCHGHVCRCDKRLEQVISCNNTIKFVSAFIISLFIVAGLFYLVIISEIPPLEKCTGLICLTILICMFILTGILYQHHSEKIAVERDLGYKTYYLERKKVEQPSKDKDMTKPCSIQSESKGSKISSEK